MRWRDTTCQAGYVVRRIAYIQRNPGLRVLLTRKAVEEYLTKSVHPARPERVARCNRAYYEKNREPLQARQKERMQMHCKEEGAYGAGMKARRKEMGLSQQQMARKLGISQATISNWERGKMAVNLMMIDAAFPFLGEMLRREDHDEK